MFGSSGRISEVSALTALAPPSLFIHFTWANRIAHPLNPNLSCISWKLKLETRCIEGDELGNLETNHERPSYDIHFASSPTLNHWSTPELSTLSTHFHNLQQPPKFCHRIMPQVNATGQVSEFPTCVTPVIDMETCSNRRGYETNRKYDTF